MFMFLTRTRDKDYRIYQDSGELAGVEAEKIFMDNLKSSRVISTETPFAILNERNEKFYIIAGGMKTGNKDREGRPVRFSFCCELEREEACKVFLTLASKWDEAVDFMRSCLEEKHGEIKFLHAEFLNWLIISEPEGLKINLQTDTPKSKSPLSKTFSSLILAALVLICGLSVYAFNLKTEFKNIQAEIASVKSTSTSSTKLNELNEIHSKLLQTLDLMGNSYRFMSMISDDAKLAVEYSRVEADKAKLMLDDIAVKIAGFEIGE